MCNSEVCPNYFSVNVSVLAVVFHWQIKKTQQFCLKLLVFWILSTKYNGLYGTFTEKKLWHNSALHITSYLSFALSKILPNSKAIKTLRNCRYLGKTTLAVYLVFLKLIFFKTFIIFLTYNQINNSNIWFAKVTIILIPIVQVLFSVFFSKKTRTLMPLSFCFRFTYTHYSKGFKVLFLHWIK